MYAINNIVANPQWPDEFEYECECSPSRFETEEAAVDAAREYLAQTEGAEVFELSAGDLPDGLADIRGQIRNEIQPVYGYLDSSSTPRYFSIRGVSSTATYQSEDCEDVVEVDRDAGGGVVEYRTYTRGTRNPLYAGVDENEARESLEFDADQWAALLASDPSEQ
ncbi:MAG TPA: hypothetical protein P5534_21825 [Candidatus Paceibacterota bacterium]|nr:hypothetical protein [Candidatus Paceibacterota bacterium]